MPTVTQTAPIQIELPGGGRRTLTADDIRGPGTSFERIAGETLSGHRIVTADTAGHAIYADPADPATAVKPLWLTTHAANQGDPVEVLTLGEHTEPSWTWTPGAALYLGDDGQLVTSEPAGAALVVRVATALTATSIFFDPSVPILTP